MKPHFCYALPPFERYSPTSGGALATITLHHARELLVRGYRVSVIAPQFAGEKYEIGRVVPLEIKHREDLNIVRRFLSSKVRGRARKYDLPYFEYYLGALKSVLCELVPDIVVLFNDLSSPTEIKQILPKTRIFVSLQNEHFRNRQSESYLNANIDATAGIWGVSDYVSERTRHAFPRASTKVATLYSGVDTETFRPRPGFLETPQPGEPVRVIYVGRTDATKGTDLVPRAVAQLQGEGENIELTVAGSTWFYDHEKQNERPYIRELRASMQAANADYLGHVARAELPAVFRAADVACVPSRFQEPFGLVALEGMASGCALIASKRGGLPEFCAGAALLVEPDQPDDFTGALRQLVRDRALLRRYKQLGRARALQYGWNVAIERMVELVNL